MSGASPLRWGLLVKNPAWNAWLQLNDFVLGLLVAHAREPAAQAPHRILIAVGGHLGDAVLATSIFRPLRAAVPGIEIGVLTSSWNRAVFAGHPAIAWMHVVDHWKLDRGSGSLVSKWLRTRRMRSSAIAEIRRVGYDAAIDLSPHYPNASRTLWKSEIPVRAGYTTGGDGPLYTHPVKWAGGRHVVEDHLALLAAVIPSINGLGSSAARSELADTSRAAAASAEDKLGRVKIKPGSYAVLHMGPGSARKRWPAEKWHSVAQRLVASGTPIVLTGAGAPDADLAVVLARQIPEVVNLCGQLSWDEFRHVLKRAKLVLSVDTVATHLAAASDTPCVALVTGMDDPTRWRPIGNQVTVLSEPVVCSPCYRSRGCAAMSCVRDITPESVLRAAEPFLSS